MLPVPHSRFTERFFASSYDPRIGLALTQACNDWIHEAWYSQHPDRIIPCGITYLAEPLLASAEIYRNARRGFRAVVLPGRPNRVGTPS